MLLTGLAILVLACGAMAVRARRLLPSALWLAACSAFLSILLYHLGAYEVAVIELSVGAGLVTVLFVFAINIAGEESVRLPSVIPAGASTHTLPLPAFCEYLAGTLGCDVTLLGIEPADTSFGEGLTPAVERAVERAAQEATYRQGRRASTLLSAPG